MTEATTLLWVSADELLQLWLRETREVTNEPLLLLLLSALCDGGLPHPQRYVPP